MVQVQYTPKPLPQSTMAPQRPRGNTSNDGSAATADPTITSPTSTQETASVDTRTSETAAPKTSIPETAYVETTPNAIAGLRGTVSTVNGQSGDAPIKIVDTYSSEFKLLLLTY